MMTESNAKPLSDFVSLVREAFEDYRSTPKSTNLAPATQQTYLRHVESFVRWLEGDSHPGRRRPEDGTR